MGRVTFEEKNKTSSVGDFPRLKLKKDERKRIVCIEDPVAEFVHRLEAPKILNGVPQMEKKERKDGTTFEDYAKDFIGAPICLGDEGILADKGIDSVNCPACEMAAKTDMTRPPQRRFAMHVVVYNTKPGSFELQSPYGCQVVVWAFTGKKFDKLVDFQAEWGSLQQHDLLLGPCTVESFQNFELGIAAKAEWLLNDERKTLTKMTFAENQTKDLAGFCGKKSDRRWLELDLQKIRDRWQEASGAPASAVNAEPSLSAGLDDLLSMQSGTAVAASPDSEPAVVDEIGEVTPKPGSSGESIVSFEDLLAGL